MDQLFTDVFLPDAQLLSIDPRKSMFLASAIIARGPIEISDVRGNIDRVKKGLEFVSWNPDCWKTGLVDVPPLGQVFTFVGIILKQLALFCLVHVQQYWI